MAPTMIRKQVTKNKKGFGYYIHYTTRSGKGMMKMKPLPDSYLSYWCVSDKQVVRKLTKKKGEAEVLQ